MEVIQIEDDYDDLSVAERWIFAKETHRILFNEESWLNNLTELDTSDPAWDELLSNKEQDEILDIFNSMLLVIKKHITQFNYSAFDSFAYFFQNDVCKLIVKSCSRIKSIISRDQLPSSGLLTMAKYCQNIVEFEIEEMEEDCDLEFGMFFRNNVHLKYLRIPLGNTNGRCLKFLENRPIEELVIKSLSMQAARHLLTLLENLHALKIFELENPWPEGISNLWVSIFNCEHLHQLVVSLRTLYEVLGNWPNNYGNIIVLKLDKHKDITDGMLRTVCFELKQLRGISLADCEKVTDMGIRAISKIAGMKELDISNLKITGESLTNFKQLERLTCSGASLFDFGLCHVILNCQNLKFLDIDNCHNVSATTIRIAAHVASQRENQLILRLILNVDLAIEKKSANPSLLQYECNSYSPGTEIMYWKFWIPYGVTNNRSSIFLDIYSKEINWALDKKSPHMYFDCLFQIITLLPLRKRIALERVSKSWEMVIKASWRTTKSLSFAEPDLAMAFFNQTEREINFIVEKLLKRVGPYLTRIELINKCSLKIVYDNCPNLKSIDTYCNIRTQSDIENLLNRCQMLTELSATLTGLWELDFKKIFHHKQPLKYLKLYMKTNLLDLLDAVNPEYLETLYLFQNFEELKKEDTNILSKFLKLKRLAMIQCHITNNLMQAIGDAKNLKFLALEQLQRVQDLNFDPIFKLKNLQELCLFYCDITDLFVKALVRQCSSLQYIDLTGCHSVTDQGLGVIVHLTYLHTLIINFNNTVDGSGLMQLSRFGLKRLECHGCQRVTEEPLCYVLINCSQLEFLDIAGCRKVNKKVVKTAIQVAQQRTNDLVLSLIVHQKLIRNKNTMSIPPLLQLLVVDYCLFDAAQ